MIANQFVERYSTPYCLDSVSFGCAACVSFPVLPVLPALPALPVGLPSFFFYSVLSDPPLCACAS